MGLTVERNETRWILRLDGDYSMTAAVELKAALTQGLTSSKELEVDLASAGEIDLTLLQLLWAAAREAMQTDREFVSRVPAELIAIARNAGFETFPGQIEPKAEAGQTQQDAREATRG